jgi:hypothetical protein
MSAAMFRISTQVLRLNYRLQNIHMVPTLVKLFPVLRLKTLYVLYIGIARFDPALDATSQGE